MIDHHELSRFERTENGAVVFARYSRDRDLLIIRHVEAAPVLRGTGAADRLMQDIVAQARADATRIRPLCGYAAQWLRRYAPDILV